MPGLLDVLLGTPNRRCCDCPDLLIFPNREHAMCLKHNRMFTLIPAEKATMIELSWSQGARL